jgi:hypothetical protein
MADMAWPTFIAPPLEPAQSGEQLLGGALLHLRGDRLGRTAGHSLSQPDGRAAGESRG